MRTSIRIKTRAPWALYWGPGPLPSGATAHGTVTRADGAVGALLRLSSGLYVQANAGAIRSLPQREVEVGLAASVVGRQGGYTTSPARAAASRKNGLLGGRPKLRQPE